MNLFEQMFGVAAFRNAAVWFCTIITDSGGFVPNDEINNFAIQMRSAALQMGHDEALVITDAGRLQVLV